MFWAFCPFMQNVFYEVPFVNNNFAITNSVQFSDLIFKQKEIFWPFKDLSH